MVLAVPVQGARLGSSGLARDPSSCPRCRRPLETILTGRMIDGYPEQIVVCRGCGYSSPDVGGIALLCPACGRDLRVPSLVESDIRDVVRHHGYRDHAGLRPRELSLLCDRAAAAVSGGSP